MMRSNHQETNNMEYETISIIIPPKPGEEHLYPKDGPITMDIACRSMCSSLEKEADLASSKLPFTWKLYEMLENVAENGQDHIVSWVDNGKAFRVHDLDGFTKEVIPTYFKQSKYKSFQRQLYFYDFKRISKGSGIGSYYHPLFVRGQKTRVLSMTPKKNSRQKATATTTSPEGQEKPLKRIISDDVRHQVMYCDNPEISENCRRISMEPSADNRKKIDPQHHDEGASWQLIDTLQNIDHVQREIRRVNQVSFAEEWNDDQSRHVQQQQRDSHIQNHWQTFLNQPTNFEPLDGETCCVFDGMAFHFVAGVPSF